VKTAKLIAEVLGKESSSGNVKCCCEKSSFLNISVEAGGVDPEKQSRTTLGKPYTGCIIRNGTGHSNYYCNIKTY